VNTFSSFPVVVWRSLGALCHEDIPKVSYSMVYKIKPPVKREVNILSVIISLI